MKIIETHPREIGFVLLDHCQNLLDDPRNQSLVSVSAYLGLNKVSVNCLIKCR